jgi:hypothetical protein
LTFMGFLNDPKNGDIQSWPGFCGHVVKTQ